MYIYRLTDVSVLNSNCFVTEFNGGNNRRERNVCKITPAQNFWIQTDIYSVAVWLCQKKKTDNLSKPNEETDETKKLLACDASINWTTNQNYSSF